MFVQNVGDPSSHVGRNENVDSETKKKGYKVLHGFRVSTDPHALESACCFYNIPESFCLVVVAE